MPKGKQQETPNDLFFTQPNDSDNKFGPKLARRNNPCELCRERRRKCDYGFPTCYRCHRLGKECQYIVTRSPADLEYTAQVLRGMMRPELEELDEKLVTMEREVRKLKRQHGLTKDDDEDIAYEDDQYFGGEDMDQSDDEPKIKQEFISPESSDRDDDDLAIVKIERLSPELDDFHLRNTSPPSLSNDQKRRSKSGIPTPPPDHFTSDDDTTNSLFSYEPLSSSSSTSSSSSSSPPPLSFSSSSSPTRISSTGPSSVRPSTDLVRVLDDADKTMPRIGMTMKFKGQFIRFETNIKKFQDLVEFVTGRLQTIDITESRNLRAHDITAFYEIDQQVVADENSYSFRGPPPKSKKLGIQPLLVIRNAIREKMEARQAETRSLTQASSSIQHINTLGLPYPEIMAHLIDIYFICIFKKYPLIHKGYFMTHLYKADTDPLNSALLVSMCAAIINWDCVHLFPPNTKFSISRATRKALGEFFFNRARDMMGDAFDEPSLPSFMTLLMMVHYMAGIMDYRQALIYQDHATRMSELLLNEYIAPDSKRDPAEIETFRRFYFGNAFYGRFLGFFTGGPPRGVSDWRVLAARIGFPRPLESEDEEAKRAIILTSQVLNHGHSHGKIQRLIFSEGVQRVPIEAVSSIERDLKAWYSQIPDDFRLPENFIEKVGGERRFRFPSSQKYDPLAPDYFTILININYHSAWLRLHEAFVPSPADTANAKKPLPTLARRSTYIVNRSAKILTLLCIRLWTYWPCHMEITAALKAADVHYRNSLAPGGGEEKEKDRREARLYFGWSLEILREYLDLRKNVGTSGQDNDEVKTWMERIEVQIRESLKDLKLDF